MNPTLLFPQPAAEPVREILHGVEVEDRFRWLEDQNSAATRAFVHAEQETYRDYLRNHSALRLSIEARVRELLTVETVDLPVPDRRGGLLYLKRKAEEEQKAIYCQDDLGRERLLLSNEMLDRDDLTSLAIVQVSRDGRYLAFALRDGGEDLQEIGIYDLEQGFRLPDRLPRGFYRGLVFAGDGTGFYYAHEETEGRFHSRRAVRRHTIGRDQRTDEEVFYGGEGPSLRLILQGAEDGSSLGYLIVSLDSEPRTRFLIHKLPLIGPPEQIVDLNGVGFGARFKEGQIEALTTYAAPRGRIVAIATSNPATEAWTDILPEADLRLCGFERRNDILVAHYVNGPNMITRVLSGSGEQLREIHYPEAGTTTLGQIDADRNRLFYAHSDIQVPPAIYMVDLTTGESVPWWQQGGSHCRQRPQRRTFSPREPRARRAGPRPWRPAHALAVSRELKDPCGR
jgi:prolyl oligopeptidase